MLVSLTSDFGLHDHFVGTMKGVILGINPDAQIVDINHAVQPFDVLDGALTISAAYSYFPAGTIHVVVVDPGVGTSRRPLVVDTGRYRFVAPDNGVLSLIYEREERATVRHVTAEHYFLHPVCATFQGRDVFAPVGAWLSKGVEAAKMGEEVNDYVRMGLPKPRVAGEKSLQGLVLRLDRFGNLITNLRPDDLPAPFASPAQPFRMVVGDKEIRNLRRTFAEGAPGEVFAIVGSTGFIEIAANRGSAAQAIGARKGSAVQVSWE